VNHPIKCDFASEPVLRRLKVAKFLKKFGDFLFDFLDGLKTPAPQPVPVKVRPNKSRFSR
jgi:hypothetical protein